jgi:predicted amidohydrolase
MKTSIVQFAPVLGCKNETLAKIQGLLKSIDKTDLLILPELASSGYNFESFDQAFELSENLKSSDFLDLLVAFAKDKNCCIASGINERDGRTLYNSSVLINKNGIQGKYRKVHLFMNEKDIFQPGDASPEVYDINGTKIGMLICFDYLFPELWRGLALKDAELICHPSNLVTPFGGRVAPVQGIINRFFVATANRIGTERGLTFNGASFISNPVGEKLVVASADIEQTISADLKISEARNKMITPRNHVLNDRRPEFY